MTKQSSFDGLVSSFRRIFREIINEYFEDRYLNNQNAFPLYDKDNHSVYIIEDDLGVFEHKYSLIFCLKKCEQESDFNLFTSSFYSKSEIAELSSLYFASREILDRISAGEIIFSQVLTDSSLEVISRSPEIMRDQIRIKINDYRIKYDEIMRKDNANLSLKKYEERYQFSRYDIKEVISYFDKESEQLTALFEQAMFCYEHNKFLASAACAGVAIEELCVLILEDQGMDDSIRKKNTTIVDLGGILRNKGIITRRISSRLNAAAIIRNSVSHTSSGYASAIDTDLLIQTFKILFEEYIQYKNRM